MKRIISILLLLFLIFPTYVAFADGDIPTPAAVVPGSPYETRASRSVVVTTANKLIYTCPVTQEYVHVTMTNSDGPEQVNVTIQFLNTEGNWVLGRAGVIGLNGTVSYNLPYAARYRVYVKLVSGQSDTASFYIAAYAG